MSSSSMDCLIQLIDVTKTFRVGKKEFCVINKANLSIKKGDFIVVLGASGSGKTTLLNMLSALDKPTSGEILVDEEDITKLSLNQLSRWRGDNVGIVFQSYNLMSYMSAVDNVMLPMVFKGVRKKQRLSKALSLLKSVGLKERLYHDSNLLSGGEQQRVAIARALVNNPKIIIADEPTGGLDLANATEIMETIYSLYKERDTTIILSTHNPNYAKFADKIIYIQKGEITVQRSLKSAIQ